MLGTLVAHAGDYVSKAKLPDSAWPGVVVEESNLAVQAAALRRVLAQRPVPIAGSTRFRGAAIALSSGRLRAR